jgi:WD40 repeat protein/energy-coupling factor transporter ATP-binding protein EcfA2
MNIDFKFGVVRIIDDERNTVGSGFVITSDGLIVTCAHVIEVARSDNFVQLFFYFPHLAKEKHEVRVASVEPDCWRDAAAEDVAFLRLEGLLPKEAVPLSLGSSFNTQGQTFYSFGFPEAKPVDGLLGECRIIGSVSEDSIPLLQLSSNQVSKGFSGAPVWDDNRQVVIGMITSIIATRRIKIASTEILLPADSNWRQTETAFATPVETLFKIYPLLQPAEVCPYRGLDAFTEDHTEFFFGREHIIDRLVNRLKQDVRFLAVLGPSGSGKSSVVQAGLVPRLRQGAIAGSDRWELVVTRPADDPFKQLAAKGFEVESRDLTASVRAWLAQHPGRTRLVFVIDQFEELLTVCSEAVRQEFVSQLTSLLAASLHITIILVMRDDFYDQFVQQETLVEWLEQSLGPINVPQTLRQAELIAIVQKPAEAVGLRFEDGLTEIIVKDTMEAATLSSDEGVVTRSSNLPLLEFALSQLWERRENGMLLRNVYAIIGGVTGGLTQWADEVFFGLQNEEKQRKTRRIFTDLVHIGDEKQGLPDSRRRMSLDLLCRDEREIEEVHQVVQRLASARLLVTSYDIQSKQEMVEIIHDALLLKWGMLKHWLQEDRSFLIWHQELERRVRSWVDTNPEDSAGREVYKLFGGSDLKVAVQWLNDRSGDLNQVERDFVQASQERQEHENQRQAVVKRRKVIVGLGLAGLGLTAAGSGTAYLVWQAFQPKYTILPILTYRGHSASVWSVAWSHDGTLIASAGADTTVQVWLASTGRKIYTYLGHQHHGAVPSVTWSPDDYRIATASYDKTVQVWASDGIYIGQNIPLTYRKHTEFVIAVAWSPNNKYIASGSDDTSVQVWNPDSGDLITKYSGHTQPVKAVAWSPNSKYIASGSGDTFVQVWDALTGQRIITYTGHKSHLVSVAWSPDGSRIASAGWDQTVQVWTAMNGSLIYKYLGHKDEVVAVSWSSDGRYIASASADKTVQVWNAQDGSPIVTYRKHTAKLQSVAWSSRETFIASAGDDKTVQVWQLQVE